MMENLKQLIDDLLFFDIGIQEYDNKFFHVVNSNIYSENKSSLKQELRKQAITELLLLEPGQAQRQLQRLWNIFNELDSDFWRLVIDESAEIAFECFALACSINNIKLKYTGVGFATITKNFCQDIQDEITDKLMTVENLHAAIESVYDDTSSNRQLSKYIENYSEELKQSYDKSIDMPLFLWIKILKDGKPINENESETIKPSRYTDLNDFSWFLNSKGKPLLDWLKIYYSGAGPVELFAMFYALIEMDLIESEKKNLRNFTLREICFALQTTFKTPISEAIASNNINQYENPSLKRRDRIQRAKESIEKSL